MAFTQPTMATNNVSLLDNKPNDNTGLTPTQLKAVFDKFGVDAKAFLINLLTELQSTTNGSSGAENIGSPTIPSLPGNTIYAQLSSVISLVNSIVLSQLHIIDEDTGTPYKLVINSGVLFIQEVSP